MIRITLAVITGCEKAEVMSEKQQTFISQSIYQGWARDKLWCGLFAIYFGLAENSVAFI